MRPCLSETEELGQPSPLSPPPEQPRATKLILKELAGWVQLHASPPQQYLSSKAPDPLPLTHNNGTFFAPEAFLDAFLEGVNHNLQQVAGRQRHGLVFHTQDGDHSPRSQDTQGCHCLQWERIGQRLGW